MIGGTVDPNISIVFDNMVSEWGNTSHAPLSVLLVHLRFLSMVHQTHHWISKGDSFYGDHLMFERIYESTVKNIDSLAEKSVGLGSTDNVNIVLHTSQVMRLMNGYGMMSTIPQPTELAKRSLAAERNFIKTTELAIDALKNAGMMTRGLDNLLAGLLDTHEEHVYLLKQRACG